MVRHLAVAILALLAPTGFSTPGGSWRDHRRLDRGHHRAVTAERPDTQLLGPRDSQARRASRNRPGSFVVTVVYFFRGKAVRGASALRPPPWGARGRRRRGRQGISDMRPPHSNLRAELEQRIRFETLLADLSARFVGLPAEALDREIEDAQRRICVTLGLERSTLGQPSQDGVPQFTHSWAVPGCMPAPHSPAAPLFPWATERIQGGHSIQFSSVDELPAEAATDKETFRRVGTQSCVCFPLMVGGKAWARSRLGPSQPTRQWPDDSSSACT